MYGNNTRELWINRASDKGFREKTKGEWSHKH
jgi:hypothetical protein